MLQRLMGKKRIYLVNWALDSKSLLTIWEWKQVYVQERINPDKLGRKLTVITVRTKERKETATKLRDNVKVERHVQSISLTLTHSLSLIKKVLKNKKKNTIWTDNYRLVMLWFDCERNHMLNGNILLQIIMYFCVLFKWSIMVWYYLTLEYYMWTRDASKLSTNYNKETLHTGTVIAFNYRGFLVCILLGIIFSRGSEYLFIYLFIYFCQTVPPGNHP